MSNYEIELIDAERRGRALAALYGAGPGDTWLVEIGSGPDAGALAAAARWAERLGAEVRKRLGAANHIERIRSGKSITIHEIPSPRTALTLTPPEAWRFVKPIDRHSPRLSCAQCRAIDQKAITVLGVPGLCLMENAALGAFAVAMDMLRPSSPGRVLVVAGGGNNGGDGLAMARMFLEFGIKADVALLKPQTSLTGDAAVNLRLLKEMPGAIIHDIQERPQALVGLAEPCILVIDALLGTGFKGRLAPTFKTAITTINATGKPILALDLPSGLDGDSGITIEAAIMATRTVTFAAVKNGLDIADGPKHSGQVWLGDIGAPEQAFS